MQILFLQRGKIEMIKGKNFGECLSSLLSILEISGNKLSKAINVDASLVSRWINNKRVPAYDTVYINSIAKYLSNNIKNSFQKQQIDELFLNICGVSCPAESIKIKIEKILLESQGYSLKFKNKVEKVDNSNNTKDNKDINSSNNYEGTQNNSAKKISYYDVNLHNSIFELSNEDKIILGIDNIFSMINFLLQATFEKNSNVHKTISITFHNNIDLIIHHYKDLIKYRDILLKAIQNGWNIIFLIGLNMDTKETAKLIEILIPLMRTGRLDLYYVNKYDTLNLINENIIVSGVGALTCFVLNQYSKNICAFYFKNKTAVNILEKHYNSFLSSYAQPLIKYYPTNHKIDYSLNLTEVEEKIGNRFLFSYSFSCLTIPENLYKKLLIKKGLSKEEAKTALEFYKRRQRAFFKNLQFYYYNDIYCLDCIDNLIRYNQIYLYDYIGIDAVKLEPPDIVELLTNIIYLLETYDNYNISFISENTNNLIQNIDLYYVIKERQAVLLETLTLSESIPKVRLSITEPTVVKAFEEYFKELTQKIPPVNKDKKEVILWLKKQTDLLKDNT